MITHSELMKELHYNSETGVFTRIKAKPSVNIGDIAGSYEAKGYISIRLNGSVYKAHRLAWFYYYGYWPTKQIDHINGVKDDNSIKNLRLATQSENLRNTKIRVDNIAGIKGVNIHKGRWIARCQINKVRVNLGSFDTKELAKSAYDNYASKNHGEFYRLN